MKVLGIITPPREHFDYLKDPSRPWITGLELGDFRTDPSSLKTEAEREAHDQNVLSINMIQQ